MCFENYLSFFQVTSWDYQTILLMQLEILLVSFNMILFTWITGFMKLFNDLDCLYLWDLNELNICSCTDNHSLGSSCLNKLGVKQLKVEISQGLVPNCRIFQGQNIKSRDNFWDILKPQTYHEIWGRHNFSHLLQNAWCLKLLLHNIQFSLAFPELQQTSLTVQTFESSPIISAINL